MPATITGHHPIAASGRAVVRNPYLQQTVSPPAFAAVDSATIADHASADSSPKDPQTLLGRVGRVSLLVAATLGPMLLSSCSTNVGNAATLVSTSKDSSATASADFDGSRAYNDVRRMVDLGPRPVGSPAHAQTISYIVDQLKGMGLQVTLQHFEADTPAGKMPMTNILATVPAKDGNGKPFITVAGHYDTKLFKDFKFVGANDGGSSAGVLLELGRTLPHQPLKQNVVLAFLDGEEAVGEWSDTDSCYGSRYLAESWQKDGTIKNMKAFVLVDMVGSKDLTLVRDDNSSPQLVEQVWNQANRLHLTQYFAPDNMPMEDDHLPFLQRGVPSIDLIDFHYGPNGSNDYWHTAQDSLDKIGAGSLQAVGQLVTATVVNLP